jgi:hypothetical protein
MDIDSWVRNPTGYEIYIHMGENMPMHLCGNELVPTRRLCTPFRPKYFGNILEKVGYADACQRFHFCLQVGLKTLGERERMKETEKERQKDIERKRDSERKKERKLENNWTARKSGSRVEKSGKAPDPA